MRIGEMKPQNGWRSGEDRMRLEEKHSGAFVLATVMRMFIQVSAFLVQSSLGIVQDQLRSSQD